MPTEAEIARITVLIKEMRKVAAPYGSMHSWWDMIFDLEELLRGRDTILKLAPEDFIAGSEKYFIDSGREIPLTPCSKKE